MTDPAGEEPELSRLDEPPNGPVVDHDAQPVSEDEAAEGRTLGDTIDPDNDDDTGLP